MKEYSRLFLPENTGRDACSPSFTPAFGIDREFDPGGGGSGSWFCRTSRRFTKGARRKSDEQPRDAAGVQPHQGWVSEVHFK